MRSILIVSDVSRAEQIAAQNELRKNISKISPSAKVVSVNYHDKTTNPTTLISDKNVEYFTAEDFTFFFRIRNEKLKEYLASEYDMALILCNEQQTHINFIAPYIRSQIKIGQRNIGEKYLNIMLDTQSQSTAELGKTMVENIKMLLTNN